MTIGFVGLGTMGKPMALNLLKGGFPLVVYSRRPEAAEPLRAAGAATAPSVADVAARADVVITMVTGTADVEEVLFGERGLVHGARRGVVAIDMSTISPLATQDMAARLAARGIDMLDAPVSGGPGAAIAGSLVVMAGGSAEVFARVQPIFAVLASSVVHLGPHGSGQAAKACNQLLIVMTTVAVAHALSLAQKLGLDPGVVQRTLMGGLASSRVLDLFGSRMASRDFRAGIETRLYHKDLGTVMDLFHRLHIEAPAAERTEDYVDALVAQGRGSDDLAALISLFEGRDWDAPRGTERAAPP